MASRRRPGRPALPSLLRARSPPFCFYAQLMAERFEEHARGEAAHPYVAPEELGAHLRAVGGRWANRDRRRINQDLATLVEDGTAEKDPTAKKGARGRGYALSPGFARQARSTVTVSSCEPCSAEMAEHRRRKRRIHYLADAKDVEALRAEVERLARLAGRTRLGDSAERVAVEREDVEALRRAGLRLSYRVFLKVQKSHRHEGPTLHVELPPFVDLDSASFVGP